MSKYDDIKTAADMMKEVYLHGLSTESEDICRVQDILGNAKPDELAVLANHDTYQEAFYNTITRVWNWFDVVQFWNAYSNRQTVELERVRAENSQMQERLHDLLAEQTDLRTRIGDAKRAAEEAEAEVVRLKAKLYDVLVEGKEGT